MFEQLVKETRLVNLIVVVLMFDVPTDDMLVDTDRRDEVAARPERLSFVETAHALDALLEPGGGLSFQELHDVGDRILRCCKKDEVNVIDLHV